MKSFINLVFPFFLALLLFTACTDSSTGIDEPDPENPDDEEPITFTSGTADFSNYVAIGNSLTAGFMDAALYDESQQFSLGAILSDQLAEAGGSGVYNQPDINSENGFNYTFTTDGGPALGRLKLDTSTQVPILDISLPSPTINGDPVEFYTGSVTELNNFGVSGITVGQLLTPDTGTPGTSDYNVYYERFASSPGSSTILEDAISANPTFFTLWIGNNDILGYALSGATNNNLTSPADFQERFSTVLQTLMQQTDAKGLVATIPPILEIPMFQTIPYDALDLPSGSSLFNIQVRTFNAALDDLVEQLDYDSADADRRRVSYQDGPNPFLIVDPNLNDLGDEFDQLLEEGFINQTQRASLERYRQARPMENHPETGPEVVLVTAAEVLGTSSDPDNILSQFGVVEPLPARFTITAPQMQDIIDARNAFNEIIKTEVELANSAETRLALYDTDEPESAFMDIFGISDGERGITVDGNFYTSDLTTSSVFSLDGVHPNGIGHGIIINEFIDDIESTFDAILPRVNVSELPGVAVCEGDCLSEQPNS
jgi:lysophospholipase L1-like esterase